MPSDDFEQRLHSAGHRFDQALATRTNAVNQEETARQTFLQQFRDMAERDIWPAFQSAEKTSSEALKIRATFAPDKDSLDLRVTVKRSPSSSISGSLRYYADLSRKLTVLEELVDNRQPRGGPMHFTDLTPDAIEKRVLSLISDLER